MKLITDYEVEGCWTAIEAKRIVRCRKCGAILKPTPKEGHFNSKYWELEQDDGCHLVNCPKGCSEESAVQSYRDFSKISYYCTKGSNPWKYTLDYKAIRNAWFDRTGKVYPVEYQGHAELAFTLEKTEQDLENEGWLKLSALTFFWERKLSHNQKDIIMDYLTMYKLKGNLFENLDEILTAEKYMLKLERK